MIGINALTQAGGSITFQENRIETELGNTSARVQRSACLDGTAELKHHGVSDGDRTFQIMATLSEEDTVALWNIYQLGVQVYLSCSEGFFLGAIETFSLNNGNLNMTFLVKEKLS